MGKKNGDPDWKTKMFLLHCHESGPRKRTEFFHHGEWFVHKDGLTEIMQIMSKPKIEEKKEKRKICLLCPEQEFDVLSHEVERWEDFNRYYERESLLVIPSVDYYMHYYEVKIPFSARKEKAIIENIEKNVPPSIYERAEYYQDQIDELRELKRGNRRRGGHFLLCPRHSNEAGIKKALQDMIEITYNWQREFLKTDRKYFHLDFPTDDEFLKMHYALEEISIEVKASEKLEEMIRKYAYLPSFGR